MIEIREMLEHESHEVKKLGRQTFEWFESLFLSKPKRCFVAVESNKIVGAVLYKYLNVKNQKLGYVDFIFVDKNSHGSGIGSKLLHKCINQMDADNCYGYSAIVRDDNVGSWKMFLNEGLKRVSLGYLINTFGLLGMLKLTFKTPMNVATGMDFYIKLNNGRLDNKYNSITQIIKYPLFSISLLLPLLIIYRTEVFYLFLSLSLLLLIRIAFGFIGTRFSKEDWRFRVIDGGYFIPLIASLFGGIYLVSGNWYPITYKKTSDFKRSLGLTSLFQWVSLIVMNLLQYSPIGHFTIVKSISDLSEVFIILCIIPLYPLSSFGGERLFKWNKVLYMFVFLLSIALTFIL